MAAEKDPRTAEESGPTPQVELARKLQLLLDIASVGRGKPLNFQDISEAMTVLGVKLSRARWFYVKDSNGCLVQDRPLLTKLANYFNVDPDYLLGVEGVEMPEAIVLQLDYVKSLRAARVKSFAARTLGDLLPETLQDIIDVLDRDIALHPGTEATNDSGGSPEGPPAIH